MRRASGKTPPLEQPERRLAPPVTSPRTFVVPVRNSVCQCDYKRRPTDSADGDITLEKADLENIAHSVRLLHQVCRKFRQPTNQGGPMKSFRIAFANPI